MVQASATASGRAWEDWRAHQSATRTETYFSILDSLRQHYPDHHVTVVPKDADLIEYAEGKNADAALDETDENHIIWRTYEVGDRRSGIDSGKIKDDTRFGRYRYSWQGHDFIVYVAEYIMNHVYSVTEKFHYILYERSKLTQGETRPKAVDDLISSATKWNEDLHDEIYMYDREFWSKSKKLWESVQQSDWNDVILDSKVKDQLINDVEGFFDNEEEYQEYAVAYRRGIILHGSPGNGKSLTIKALIHSLSKRDNPIPALYVKSFRGCQGEWYNIREVFEKARAMSPCLLIFEDLDSMVTEKVRSFFLNEVDGLEDNHGILILGSTNYLEKLDPSITKRPSRFDRKYKFALPAHAERVKYADYWQAKLAKTNKVEYPEGLSTVFADFTDGFSFAYLKEVFITSLLSIVGAKRLGLEQPDDLDDNEESPLNSIYDSTASLKDVLLWRVMQKQIKVLRKEMEEAEAARVEKEKKEEKEKEKDKAKEEQDGESDCC